MVTLLAPAAVAVMSMWAMFHSLPSPAGGSRVWVSAVA